MNQKAIVVILVIILVILFGTIAYFAINSNVRQPEPVVKQSMVPTTPTPVTQAVLCGKLDRFKDESWAYNFVAQGGVFNDINEGCKIEDVFLANIGPSEFGCDSVVKYDIENNILTQTLVAAPNACATHFGEVTKNYVEYFGSQGDGGEGRDYHGRYYFKEDRIEDLK